MPKNAEDKAGLSKASLNKASLNKASLNKASLNKKMRNRFLLMLGAFFGVMLIADITLVRLASKTWSGVTESNHYEKGLAYNEQIEQAQKQKTFGWKVKAGFSNEQVTVKIKDAQNRPLGGLLVTVKAVRPTHDGYDKTVTLSSDKLGVYSGDLELPLKGQWQLQITAEVDKSTNNSQQKFYQEQVITVQ